MRHAQWTLPFKSLNGTTCRVDIYAEGSGGGTPITLTGGAKPFYFDETNSDDLLTTVRHRSGYICVVETSIGDLNDINPKSAKERYVEFYFGNTLVFTGYIQHQNFDRPYTAAPRELKFPVVSPLGLLEAFDFAAVNPPTTVTLGSLLQEVVAGLDAGYTHVITPDIPILAKSINSLVVSPFNGDFSHFSGTVDDLFKPISFKDFIDGLCMAFGLAVHDTPTHLIFSKYDHMGSYVEYDLATFTGITIPNVGSRVMILSSAFTFADSKASQSVIMPKKKIVQSYEGEYTTQAQLDFSRLKTVDKSSGGNDGRVALWLKTLNDEYSGIYLQDSTTFSVLADMFYLRDRGVFLTFCGHKSGNDYTTANRILINPDPQWAVTDDIITIKYYNRPLAQDFNILVRYTWGTSISDLAQDMEVNHYCPEAFVRVGGLWHHYELDPISGLYEHSWQTLRPVTGETSSQGVYNFDIGSCPDGPVEVIFRLSHNYSPGQALISIDTVLLKEAEDVFSDYTVEKKDEDVFRGSDDGIGDSSVKMLFSQYRENTNMISGTLEDFHTDYAYMLEAQSRLKSKWRSTTFPAMWNFYLHLVRYYLSDSNWRLISLSFNPKDEEYTLVTQGSSMLSGTT